jgi:trehalose 6-phosphate phosphatase
MTYLSIPPLVPLDRAALFLDFDGTLTPFAPTPDGVEVNPSLCALLREADRRLGGRLAVISGRTVADLDRLLDSAVPCLAGVHGLQRRDLTGRLHEYERHPALEDAATVLEALAAARFGLIVERKGHSVAIHYRQTPEAREALAECAGRLAQASGLTIQDGDMVVELRTPGPDKGAAVKAFMEHPPFAGAVPIYIGDDLTDEAAFKAVSHFGGFGVLVGDRRPTAAAYSLVSPPRVLDWVSASLEGGAFNPECLRWVA